MAGNGGIRRELAIVYQYSIHIVVDSFKWVIDGAGAGRLQIEAGGVRQDCHSAERIMILRGWGQQIVAVCCGGW